MPTLSIASTKVQVSTGNLPDDMFAQNTGANTLYVSDDPNILADSTSIAIPAGTPFTWRKNQPLFAVCASGYPTTITYYANGASMGVSLNSLLAPSNFYINALVANTLYYSNYTWVNGIYVITCPTAITARLDFYDANNNLIASATTASGTITINLATTAVRTEYWVTSGSNVNISVVKTGENIPYAPSGAVNTITANQTFTGVGLGYFYIIGGGQGGAKSATPYKGGNGGRSGNVFSGYHYFSGSTAVVIGQGTNGATVAGNASSPTDTTLDSITSASGVNVAGAITPTSSGAGTNGLDTTAISDRPFFNQGTTGSGASGGNASAIASAPGGSGGGNGIGSAGNGGLSKNDGTTTGTVGSNATGYGAGGGGGGADISSAKNGGNGSNGVAYIII